MFKVDSRRCFEVEAYRRKTPRLKEGTYVVFLDQEGDLSNGVRSRDGSVGTSDVLAFSVHDETVLDGSKHEKMGYRTSRDGVGIGEFEGVDVRVVVVLFNIGQGVLGELVPEKKKESVRESITKREKKEREREEGGKDELKVNSLPSVLLPSFFNPTSSQRLFPSHRCIGSSSESFGTHLVKAEGLTPSKGDPSSFSSAWAGLRG